ncbi:MAG: hypothetical protein QF357_11410 [Dehalococcoidia bacterium]|jgi:uncharacterized membrane protein|nr:hypothetical protein [Dehalococcoidia bacterium]
MDAEIVSLRILHIVPGVVWVGAAIFMALILQPALAKAGPPHAGILMDNMVKPLTILMHSMALLTIVIGVVLAFRMHPDGLFDVLWSTGWGWMIFIGLVFAVVGYTSGFLASQTMKKVGILGASFAGRPPEPAEMAEMGKLQGRGQNLTRLAALLATAAVVTMALARYAT